MVQMLVTKTLPEFGIEWFIFLSKSVSFLLPDSQIQKSSFKKIKRNLKTLDALL